MHPYRIQKALLFVAVAALIACKASNQTIAQMQNPSAAGGRASHALPTRALPAGFESYKDPQSTGRLIYIKSGDGPASAA